MTRVVLFAPKYPPETGGASVYFKQAVELLEDTDHDVSVFAPMHDSKPERETEHGATILRVFPPVGARIYTGCKYIRQLDNLLQEIQPEIAHVHPHFPQYRWFRFLLKLHRIPRIYDCRDKDFSRRYVKDGSFYLSATEDIDQILIDEVGANPAHIARSPVSTPDVVPQTHGVGGQNTVGFVGELTKHKGLEKTVYAVSELISDRDITLHVAGDGPLREWVEGLDADTSWLKYHGELSHAESMGLINAVDVVCIPSKREGRPRVALEAMQMGTPVVGSTAGDIPEVIGEAGVIVDRTIPEVRNGIETVLNDADFTRAAEDRDVDGEKTEVRDALLTAYEAVKPN